MIIEARDDVVKLEGRLEKNLWPTIQAAANLLLRHHAEGIIIDGGGLSACSLEGAKTFRDAMDYIERYRARIVVCQLPPVVMETLRAVPGVRSRLPIAATLEEARASLNLGISGAGRAATGSRQLQDILVPLIGNVSPEVATALACRIAKSDPAHKAQIHLAYVLEIPRMLPLTAPLPEEESVAGQIMERAQLLVSREGLNVATYVSRARDAAEEIVALATKLQVNIIVISYMPSGDTMETAMDPVTRTLLTKAPCEVILNKLRPA